MELKHTTLRNSSTEVEAPDIEHNYLMRKVEAPDIENIS